MDRPETPRSIEIGDRIRTRGRDGKPARYGKLIGIKMAERLVVFDDEPDHPDGTYWPLDDLEVESAD
jgi:hypothetical protein